jgi:predicted lipoprotein with Yx(FWY)xxD motif
MSTFLILLVLACKKDSYVAPVAKGVAIANDPTFGKIITDDLGKTLYFFSADIAGTNTCQAGCASNWPVFHVSNISIGAGLDASDFAEITNSDGSKQTTYKGWPLYYYIEDKKSGDVLGDKVGNLWYVGKPDYAIMISFNPSTGKKYLVAPKGKTLYAFNNDTNGASSCTGACVSSWPPFSNNSGIVPSILSATSMGLATGSQQTTYKGMPLYYNSQDQVRGDAKGQGFANGLWNVVDETRF